MTVHNSRTIEYLGADLQAMESARNLYRWILHEFRPFLRGHVCEVGAGQGNFTQHIPSGEVQSLTALEPSRGMFLKLQKRMSGTPRVQLVNNSLTREEDRWRGAFDTMCYVNVLEHIANDGRELRAIHSSLRNSGRLLIYVPALSWLSSPFDKEVGHFRRYEKESLARKVRAAGFSIVKAHYVDMLGVIPWYLLLVVLRRDLSPSSVALYDRLVLPLVRMMESALRPPIGKNLILIAEKQDVA